MSGAQGWHLLGESHAANVTMCLVFIVKRRHEGSPLFGETRTILLAVRFFAILRYDAFPLLFLLAVLWPDTLGDLTEALIIIFGLLRHLFVIHIIIRVILFLC